MLDRGSGPGYLSSVRGGASWTPGAAAFSLGEGIRDTPVASGLYFSFSPDGRVTRRAAGSAWEPGVSWSLCTC